MLKEFINLAKAEKDILLMTHLVLGYPSFEKNRDVIDAMAGAGVELVELQIPFSEPMADGPVILKANNKSIDAGTEVSACFEFAAEMTCKYPLIRFLFMTYYNIIFKMGSAVAAEKMKQAGIAGTIIPDLPMEESTDWNNACAEKGLENITLFTPTNTDDRLKALSESANGFVYSIGRRGVTGTKTNFDESIHQQINRYRSFTDIPLALGFGVQTKEDVDFLRGKVDIAVIGSKVIQLLDSGADKENIRDFLSDLR